MGKVGSNQYPIYLYHHLGLGDHIIMSGLVRFLYEQCNPMLLFCYEHNYKNIVRLYQDLEHLTVKGFVSDMAIESFIVNHQARCMNLCLTKKDNWLMNVWDKIPFFQSPTFDVVMYRKANVPHTARWDQFYYQRDNQKEEAVFQSVIKKVSPKYIFLHDDPSRQDCIDRTRIASSLPIYQPDHRLGETSNWTLFDYAKVIEQAEEIHVMDSAFACFAEHLDLSGVKRCVIHRYIRGNKSKIPEFRNKEWTILL
ncbi:hypothetical protein N9L24_04470 [Candidatus Marinamargulisbacteria bacterium]|nr:hypothetical protein [Candidatus Marinamargulisbacteria bacterium]